MRVEAVKMKDGKIVAMKVRHMSWWRAIGERRRLRAAGFAIVRQRP